MKISNYERQNKNWPLLLYQNISIKRCEMSTNSQQHAGPRIRYCKYTYAWLQNLMYLGMKVVGIKNNQRGCHWVSEGCSLANPNNESNQILWIMMTQFYWVLLGNVIKSLTCLVRHLARQFNWCSPSNKACARLGVLVLLHHHSQPQRGLSDMWGLPQGGIFVMSGQNLLLVSARNSWCKLIAQISNTFVSDSTKRLLRSTTKLSSLKCVLQKCDFSLAE